MTDAHELRMLQSRMKYYGVTVTYFIGNEGAIEAACIIGAPGLREHIRDPLSAAEAMRRWIKEKDITTYYAHGVHYGQQFRNGRWRN